jgi:outer membrane lipoprotein-sorting protein
MHMRFLLAVLAFLLLPSFAQAELNPEQQQDVQAVESYLGGISTLKARFVQTANDGKQLMGTFYLKRPGRMRIDYDAPVTDFIVADGLLVYSYDGEMKQQSNAPIGKSLADFFLRRDLKLSGDVTVSDIKSDKKSNTLELTLIQTRNPLAGSLTLTMSQSPMQLLQWEVVDAQGLTTQVRLLETQTGITLDRNLFHYIDPTVKTH